MNEREIIQLVDAQSERTALARAFYLDPDIYERDIERIFLNSWLYAGHESEIPNPGDWFLFEFAGESAIVIRGRDDEINVLLNVCRHRGSRVCIESRGRSRRLTCPYHGWTYRPDGRLLAAAHMDGQFDRSAHSLQRIRVESLEGLIFVNLSTEPALFDPVRAELTECLRPYRLDTAKVAHRASYPIESNWKLAVENYCECYHCGPAHPEYSRGHSLADPDERHSELHDSVMARARQCGLGDRLVHQVYMNSPGFGADLSYWRYPLLRGHVTGSEDGKPVAPLMGDIKDYDGGATDLQVGPVTFGLLYCDHAVIYRFVPLAIDRAECDITWLVDGEAEEGRDYDKNALTWLWDITTHADKRIIEHNQQGVNSRFYRPGPLSEMEDYEWQFLDWYLDVQKK